MVSSDLEWLLWWLVADSWSWMMWLVICDLLSCKTLDMSKWVTRRKWLPTWGLQLITAVPQPSGWLWEGWAGHGSSAIPTRRLLGCGRTSCELFDWSFLINGSRIRNWDGVSWPQKLSVFGGVPLFTSTIFVQVPGLFPDSLQVTWRVGAGSTMDSPRTAARN